MERTPSAFEVFSQMGKNFQQRNNFGNKKKGVQHKKSANGLKAQAIGHTNGVSKKKRQQKGKKNVSNSVKMMVAAHEATPSSLNDLPLPDPRPKPKKLKDSAEVGEECLEWMIHPFNMDQFFQKYWEQKPLFIKRQQEDYYSNLLSSSGLDKILRDYHLRFTKNIDITSYQNGERQTHNPDGRARAAVVWDFYNTGCSVRLLNPQTFIKTVWNLNANLQEFFGCFVGANVYLTPPGTQGFAPHYDDIEAFILQLEGKKHWRVYKPVIPSDELARVSSKNFSEDEIGKPILEVTLEAGDLLYFPRGYIHQGYTSDDMHSLHITVSAYQKTSWADYLEKLVPAAIKIASEEDVSFRRGLPLGYLNHLGIAFSETESPLRTEFMQTLSGLWEKLLVHAPIDDAADQMGKQFMHDALPPVLKAEEKSKTICEEGERIENGVVSQPFEIESEDKIRLLRRHGQRIVREAEAVRLYYTVDNSREYHGEEPQFVELPAEHAAALEYLQQSYPHYVTVDDLPLEDITEKVAIASTLWDKGLILCKS